MKKGPLPGAAHGIGVYLQHLLDLVYELQRCLGGTVQLVYEGEDGDAALPAYLEELDGLALDSLSGVEHHDYGIHGHEHAVGVRGKVLVTRGVQKVQPVAAVLELQYR